MPDLLSELKRIKGVLNRSPSDPAVPQAPRPAKPVLGLPQVTPLKKSVHEAAPGSRSNPVAGQSSVLALRQPNTAAPAAPLPALPNSVVPRPAQPSHARAADAKGIRGQSGLASKPAPNSTAKGRQVSSAPTAAPAQIVGRAQPNRDPGASSTTAIRPTSPKPLNSPVRAKEQRAPSTRPVQEQAPKVLPVSTDFRPLAKGAPTRQSWFRTPEAWLVAGGKTQSVDAGQMGAVDVVIGLDFGTSFTKAAVGLKDKIFPVTWEGVSGCSPHYLLPSEYTELEDGSLFIGQHPVAPMDRIRGDLKLPFIKPGVSTASIGAAGTFIALVLRYIRAWVFHHHAAKLGRAKIRWQLNIGAPSNGLESGRLVSMYRVLAATAWLRSLETDPQRLAGSTSQIWREGEPLLDLIDLQVLPEFVAQMAGYMQSPQRQQGLHALVDVGGGTLDVVTFNVHRVDDEDTFPFLVPQVHSMGTHGLIQNRLLDVKAGQYLHPIDELAPIDSAPVFALATGVDEAHVFARDALFKSALQRVIKGVFETTKSRRYRLSDAWRTGVRTFFTGGGSQFELYRDALTTASIPSTQGLHLMPLPAQKNLDGFSGAPREYQRISVACGLAQDAFTLGKIVPAREVEDDDARVSAHVAGRPDRDELYPK